MGKLKVFPTAFFDYAESPRQNSPFQDSNVYLFRQSLLGVLAATSCSSRFKRLNISRISRSLLAVILLIATSRIETAAPIVAAMISFI